MDALCACGCGAPAGVYATSNSALGIAAGQPKRFIHGHHSRVQTYPDAAAADLDAQYTIDTTTGCWVWSTIHPGDDGYGRVWVNGRKHKAHRVIYERDIGTVPAKTHLDHRCRNRACVNPQHLRVLSHADNCRIGANAKITAAQAEEIRQRLRDGARGVHLAAEFGVSPQTISAVKHFRSWA